jgi:predicted DNA-binding transcriptional regulator AlpA
MARKLSVASPAVPAFESPNSSIIDPSQILTLSEVSARLKVSERWVYEKTRHRCQNPLPVIRIGRYLRFLWGDVSAWMRQHSNSGRAA